MSKLHSWKMIEIGKKKINTKIMLTLWNIKQPKKNTSRSGPNAGGRPLLWKIICA